MPPNPALGVFYHAMGGFAAGSFYAPLKKIRGWAWESYWLMMGVAAWLVAPWAAAWLTTPDLGGVIRESLASERRAVLWSVFFGMLWGLGNLTFGLTVRYLGMALGYAMALGFCMVFGSLLPPIVEGEGAKLVSTGSGQTILAGILVCLAGIAMCGIAGIRREREQSSELTSGATAQVSVRKGSLVAMAAGILSACFVFGLLKGEPIAEISLTHGTRKIYKHNAVFIAVLAGGFLSNASSCLYLNLRNNSIGDYTRFNGRYPVNCLLAWVAGVTWYFQFFFYGMGESTLGKGYSSASWAIHMAFIVVFSNLWGIVFHEWRGTKPVTRSLVWLGILLLIASTFVIGYGKSLAPAETPAAATSDLR